MAQRSGREISLSPLIMSIVFPSDVSNGVARGRFCLGTGTGFSRYFLK
jgi:hypothetical protein